ncbi:MAG: hypothetical protein LBD16_00025, partial [Oscillospiraceae bacterium]|nr:hypothetical protein [Oscillospiraceae bacterium]
MFRRNNIANRFACFILAAAMLVASLGFPFSAAAVGTFYVNLYTDDGWGNLTPLLPHEIEVDQTQPHLWLTLPADIPLNNVVAVFTTSDGSRAVIVMNEEGVPIALDTNGVTDYSYSEGEPFAFALLNEASEFIYQGQLTISYAPSPFATAEPTVTEEPYVEPSQEPAITPEPAPFPEGYNTSGHAWILSGTDLYDTPNGSSINSLN